MATKKEKKTFLVNESIKIANLGEPNVTPSIRLSGQMVKLT